MEMRYNNCQWYVRVAGPGVVHLIAQLEPEHDTNSALERLLENEMIRRLNRYQLTDRTLRRKYGMSFPEFKARRMVKVLV
jgi:hypothetical protein